MTAGPTEATAGASPRIAAAMRWPGRIVGLDLARAAAIIGMLAAHVGDSGHRGNDADGWGWLWVADGRPSAVFAVLAGVTVTLIARADAVGAGHAAIRVAVRGAILIGAGFALGLLDTPIAVILTHLGVMLLVVIPAMRWGARALFAAGGVVLVGGAVAYHSVALAAEGIPVAQTLTGGYYPVIAWAGYVLVGMGIGRLALREVATAGALVWMGAVAAVAGYGLGALAGSTAPWQEPAGPWWASLEAHSTSPAEMVGNTGVALLVIGVCLLLARPTAVFFPVLAFGSMSLSVYTAHVIVIAMAGDQIVWEPSNVSFAALTLSLMAAATVWRVAWGAGPLERLMTIASSRTADALAAPRVPHAPRRR
ncbi:heparan-alpha-glucosaminide N-acetyltransferase domain-containing protein [Demequina sp.]|uniref:heparan-alpha-glucosaminide N-acetyltransferase domain-containing protein n=1 Tax=Demequina sp. TaxID=2050685 RepID=UPI0025BCBE8F|nr:heparan-alpha-glucosaminide N-acetyltransferase domain-containing protein [Demequina sp.]